MKNTFRVGTLKVFRGKENQTISGFLLNTCCGQQQDSSIDSVVMQVQVCRRGHQTTKGVRDESLPLPETRACQRIQTLPQREVGVRA